MILSSCHHCLWNNDSHCHCDCDSHSHYMQRIYVYFMSPCLVLSCLVLTWVELTSITIVIIGMMLYELVLHYHITSYHVLCSLILSADLFSIRFYYILFYSIPNWSDWMRLNLIYYIVQYCISYQWMICVYLSVSVCVWGRRSWEKSKERETKMKREKKEK